MIDARVIGTVVVAAGAAAGYVIATQTKQEIEHPLGIKILLTAPIIFALLSAFWLPWWWTLLLAGALALGWIPAAFALGVIGTIAGSNEMFLALAAVLAVFTGTRCRMDKQSFLIPILGSILAAGLWSLIFGL